MRDAAVGKLRISTQRRDRIAVIEATGEIDLETAETLAAALRSQIAAGVDGIVLDLLGVPFMDSSGLKVLLKTSNELRDRLVVVLSPGSPVCRLLEIAEIADRISVRATVEDAVASLASAGG
jgi:stage II sporulation protein AA (anti-sigma F factor antagonist)